MKVGPICENTLVIWWLVHWKKQYHQVSKYSLTVKYFLETTWLSESFQPILTGIVQDNNTKSTYMYKYIIFAKRTTGSSIPANWIQQKYHHLDYQRQGVEHD